MVFMYVHLCDQLHVQALLAALVRCALQTRPRLREALQQRAVCVQADISVNVCVFVSVHPLVFRCCVFQARMAEAVANAQRIWHACKCVCLSTSIYKRALHDRGGTAKLSCPSNSSSPAGSVACTCNPGFYGPASGPCSPCPAGSYCT